VEKGLHLALVHVGRKFHRDLWIVFLEVPVGNQRLFRFSLEKILDREVTQPLERRGSAPEKFSRYINGLRYEIHDESSMMTVRIVEVAYKISLKAEEKLARN
jgi:hypothetical protein